MTLSRTVVVAVGSLALAAMGGPGSAVASPAACTMEVDRHPDSRLVSGLFGGARCSDSWVSVNFSFAPDSVNGIEQHDAAGGLQRPIDVWTNSHDLPWPVALGWWGSKRLALRVGPGSMTGGVGMTTHQEASRGMSGEPVGTPVTVSLVRRDMPRGARSIHAWNLGSGRCQIGDGEVSVDFDYREDWSDGADFSAVTDLRSITVTNNRLYGPLCLALVLATPLPD